MVLKEVPSSLLQGIPRQQIRYLLCLQRRLRKEPSYWEVPWTKVQVLPEPCQELLLLPGQESMLESDPLRQPYLELPERALHHYRLQQHPHPEEQNRCCSNPIRMLEGLPQRALLLTCQRENRASSQSIRTSLFPLMSA